MHTFFLCLFLVLGCKPEEVSPVITPANTNASSISELDPDRNPPQPAPADTIFEVAHDYPDDIEIDSETPETIKYLALGDSYTIGQSVPEDERWPVQLAAKINEESDEVQVSDPFIIATTGWTTANLSDGMDALMIDTAQFDLVSLLIGVNNQYQGLSLDAYEVEYEVLLERAIALAGGNAGRVFVVSIPDYGYTPFGEPNQETISAELAEFNAACQSITEEHGVAHYNITPISQQWPDVPDLVAPDNLHPSGTQYGLWVESFWQLVAEQMNNN